MKEIKFVDVGEGITEGQLQKWLVSDGDSVKEDQPIFEIETDKAVVNIPSPIDGVIKIAVKAGSIVHLGDTIAYVGTKDELSATLQKGTQQQSQNVQATSPQQQNTSAPAPQQQNAQ